MRDDAREIEDDAIATLMRRAATAFGRDEAAPDPTLILIKAELERQALRERRALRHRLIGIGLSSLAIVTSAAIAASSALACSRVTSDFRRPNIVQ